MLYIPLNFHLMNFISHELPIFNGHITIIVLKKPTLYPKFSELNLHV